MKEEDKATTRELSERDLSNMPDGEFKATVIRIVTGLEKRMEGIKEILTTEIRELKKNQSEMKNVINQTGNWLDALNNRLEEAEE